MPANYRRTPLPNDVQTPVGWVAVCLLLLIFSPFVGFAIHGKVNENGLETGLKFAMLPLSALIFFAVRRWRNMQRIPPHILEEWRLGRVVTAKDAATIASPVRFARGKNWIEMQSDGVVISSYNFLGIYGAKDSLATLRTVQQCGHLFILWNDVVEWIVDADSDGPDYYVLKLQQQGELKIRRFDPEIGTECDLLEAVRSIGKLSIRIHCDVECK